MSVTDQSPKSNMIERQLRNKERSMGTESITRPLREKTQEESNQGRKMNFIKSDLVIRKLLKTAKLSERLQSHLSRARLKSIHPIPIRQKIIFIGNNKRIHNSARDKRTARTSIASIKDFMKNYQILRKSSRVINNELYFS